eukprot:TRINITY_DN6215_c0_g1_i7.p1 TRINITY_DN6215_c0_g1~~TRINITY_DN6215_c0_g1_i7.p1  ORF type:complete len:499 (-),score=29.18 TRINITY_DN6215_c0_g1_i7:57-1553(-)
MESIRVVRPSGAELVLELAEGSTVLDAKKSIEATTGVHVVEQKLLADAEVLENGQRLDSVTGLASSLTLVHDPPVPWCWPCREVSEPTGTHKLLLYEDPKVTEEDVLYPSPIDEDFDETVRERWRKRGLRCVPGFGLHVGKELSFEYLTCQRISQQGESHSCSVFRAESNVKPEEFDGEAQFINACLRIALQCPGTHVWPAEALEHAITSKAWVAKNPVHSLSYPVDVKLAALNNEGFTLQVSSTISFGEFYHIAAAELFRAGHHFPDGFDLWTHDGCTKLPTSSLKLLQPALKPKGGLIFSCIAVPHSAVAVAVAGVGVFTPATLPAKEVGIARVGVCFPVEGRPTPLPAMEALRRLPGNAGYDRSCGRSGSMPDTLVTLDLGENIANADDFESMPKSSSGHVLQLFNISSAGVVLANVRHTSDGNMVGGSYEYLAVPADASSTVIRGFLAAGHSPNWSRLSSARDNSRLIVFDELRTFGDLAHGLCICSADHDERR